MKRSGPLKRTAMPKARKPLPRKNAKRAEARHVVTFGGGQSAMCRELPCAACLRVGRSVPAHVRSRGAGGVDSDTIPLCEGIGGCHPLQENNGWGALAAKYGVPAGPPLESASAMTARVLAWAQGFARGLAWSRGAFDGA